MTSPCIYRRPRFSTILCLIAVASAVFVCGPIRSQTTPAVATAKPADDALNTNDVMAVDAILSKLTLNEKIDLIAGSRVFATASITRLGIPAFGMTDGPAGAHIPPPSTAYAAGIGLAATWDRDLAQEIGKQLGRDARSRGARILLGPGVNIYRAPLNGRNYEYFGEDPFLAAEVAVAYIDGIQSQGVSATVKHFAANNSEFLRNTSDSVVSERALREIYLPAFEAAVRKAHVGAIMDSYNLVNGRYATQNYRLNVEIAKRDWGFDGVIMSDWGAVHDGVAAANAGLDLEMPDAAFMNAKTLLPAIANGNVEIADIDDKVRRILRLGYRFGWMDTDPTDLNIPRYSQQGRLAALQSARESIVLLKNNGNILPLNPEKLKTIAVIGPNAFPATPTAGGSGQVPTYGDVSILKGISDRLGLRVNVLYDRGIQSLAVLSERTNFMQYPDDRLPGLTVESFDNPEFGGRPIATKAVMTGVSGQAMRDTSDIMSDLFARLPNEQLAATLAASSPNRRPHYDRWTGYYLARAAGNFVLFVQHAGRYRLIVDGRAIIDHSVIPKSALAQQMLELTAGPHKVVLELDDPQSDDSMIRLGVVEQGTFVDQAAIDMAKKADAVILAVGYDADIEGEGHDRAFQLPPGEDELIDKIAAANPNVIVTVSAGGSVDASSWIDRIAGLVHNWYPGEEGGTALAEILFGDINPSGKLPISWEKELGDNPSISSYYPTPGTLEIPYKDDIFVGYRGYEHNRTKPLFPFGFGLSYTSFSYSALSIDPGALPGTFEVSFDVTNTGLRTGADVAQVYISEDHPSVPRPPQELKGFARVSLEPGQSRRVMVPLDARSFSWYDEKAAAWHANKGRFTVHVSRSSTDRRLGGAIMLKRDMILPVDKQDPKG